MPRQAPQALPIQEEAIKTLPDPPATRPGEALVEYTFKELNFLSDELVLRGLSPRYDFFVPIYSHLVEARALIYISAPDYLLPNSTIIVLLNDVPYKSFSAKAFGGWIEVPILPNDKRQFAKITIQANLRLSNNICEDAFSDNAYIKVSQNSLMRFVYKIPNRVENFIRDYNINLCLEEKELLPAVYYISLVNKLPQRVSWGLKEGCRNIKLDEGPVRVENGVLYFNKESLKTFSENLSGLLFSESIDIGKVQEQKRQLPQKIMTLREMGIRNTTIRGMSNLNFSIPFDLSRFGGMPDTLHIHLRIEHTPIHQKDKAELRIYLNDFMIKAIMLEGFGGKSFDVKLPVRYLQYGSNNLSFNLVNFTSSDNCFGAIAQSAFTVFEDSYFYWNDVEKRPLSISDFLKSLNGKVAIIVKDEYLLDFLVKLIAETAKFNKNITKIDLVQDERKLEGYDFVIRLDRGEKDPKNAVFTVINPMTNQEVYSAKYEEPFVYLILRGRLPTLQISYLGEVDSSTLNYNAEDFLNFYGDLAVLSENYISSFEISQKLKLTREHERSLSYYWNRFKIVPITILAAISLAFLIYVYKKLTRRPG
ncbi:MAG: cellulose biosynthesis cyclic di-GMP-binding regulatory protein BcsB [Aquificaceae bacterium]